MAASTSTLSANEAAERKLRRLAILAESEGNERLAVQLLSQLHQLPEKSGTEFVRLPNAGSLDELWAVLGMNAQDGRFEVTGVFRRLAAAVSSIRERGFDNREFVLGCEGRERWLPFAWESEGGAWTPRHWRVTGRLRLLSGRPIVLDSEVAVESSAARKEGRSEWTVFSGGPLNTILAEKLGWVFAHQGAALLSREKEIHESWTPLPLSDEERAEYDSVYNVLSALGWKSHPDAPTARVILASDSWGKTYISSPPEMYRPDLTKMLAQLRQLWLSKVERGEVDMTPPLSGRIC